MAEARPHLNVHSQPALQEPESEGERIPIPCDPRILYRVALLYRWVTFCIFLGLFLAAVAYSRGGAVWYYFRWGPRVVEACGIGILAVGIPGLVFTYLLARVVSKWPFLWVLAMASGVLALLALAALLAQANRWLGERGVPIGRRLVPGGTAFAWLRSQAKAEALAERSRRRGRPRFVDPETQETPASLSGGSPPQRVPLIEFREDLRWWVETDRRIAERVLDLVEAVMRDPTGGVGKPEPLRYLAPNTWSRRITQEHRLVYLVSDDRVDFLQARYHY